MALSYASKIILILLLVCWQNCTPILCENVLWLMKIYDSKADDQDMLKETKKQNAEADKVSTSRKGVKGDVM